MKKVIFVYDLNYDGGVETLLIRLSDYYKERDCKLSIWSRGLNNKDLCEKLKQNKVFLLNIDKWSDKAVVRCIKESIKSESNISFIHFIFSYFMWFERIKKKNKLSINNSLYIVHPNQLIRGQSIKIGMLERRVVSCYKDIICKYIKNRSIIFMDEASIDKAEKYYGYHFEINEYVIARLPIITCETTEKCINRIKYDVFAAARAEFPFKGYLIGLVRDFVEINSDGNYKLLLISDGNDVEQLMEIIPKDYPSIDYLPSVNYSDFKKYMDESRIFIGMGTSVLDAADLATPSIMAVPYSNLFKSNGFFHENPLGIGALDGIDSGICQLKTILQLSDRQYLDISRKTKNLLRRNYDVSAIAPLIMDNQIIEKGALISQNEYFVDFINTKTRIAINYLHSQRKK